VNNLKQDRIKTLEAALAHVADAKQALSKIIHGTIPSRISLDVSQALQRTVAAIDELEFEIGEWRKESE
jgi:hypothetical protein